MPRHSAKDAPKVSPAKGEPAGTGDLEERIERLEKRLEETIASPDRPHVVVKTEIDKTETADPLRRAVDRVSGRRDSDK